MASIRLRKAGVVFLLAFIFSNTAVKAAGDLFDGGYSGVSLSGARVYDFKQLYKSLGYPRPDYSGANETEIMDLDAYTSKYDTFYKEINGYLRFHPAPYTWYGTGPEDAKVIVENIDRIFTLEGPSSPSTATSPG